MEQNENSLNFGIATGSLLKYALPTILSNVFMNIYSIVDQLFVSNLLGTDTLSAVSIASPFLTIALAIGTMIATGGCALVSKRMGKGTMKKPGRIFPFLCCSASSSVRYSVSLELCSGRRSCMRWAPTLRFTESVKPMPCRFSCRFRLQWSALCYRSFLLRRASRGLGSGCPSREVLQTSYWTTC